MAELLSKAQYAAIAAELRFPTQAFIDGSFRDAVSGRTFASSNPATGERLADIAACDAEDVNLAVASARLAFEDGRWSKRSPASARRSCSASPSCSKTTPTSWR